MFKSELQEAGAMCQVGKVLVLPMKQTCMKQCSILVGCPVVAFPDHSLAHDCWIIKVDEGISGTRIDSFGLQEWQGQQGLPLPDVLWNPQAGADDPLSPSGQAWCRAAFAGAAHSIARS